MRVGITGHQNLGSIETVTWIKSTVLKNMILISVSEAYSCLAIGADQLFAMLVLRSKIPLVAVIPCHNYEKTFKSTRNLDDYLFYKKNAFKTIQLPYENPSETAFYEGGKTIVENSDIIFAIWNEKPAKGLGGTGDVVNYAISLGKKIIHINPISKSVKLINYS